MELLNYHTLRKSADSSLERAPQAKWAIFLHTGVVLLLALVVSILDYLLEQQIGTTGGLSGLGMRSVLSTIQSVLRLMQTVLLPFWQIGYTYFVLRTARGEEANTSNLFQGFCRFGPVLRLKLLTAGIAFLVSLIATYLSSTLFLFTPWAASFSDTIQPLMDSALDEAAFIDAMTALSAEIALPMGILFVLCFAGLGLPVFYRYRMAEFWLMDHPECGALAALRNSKMLMRGNRISLFKVDLHFWWFYALDVLVSLVGFMDLLLAWVGVPLPMSATAGYFLFLGLYLILQLGLYCWRRNQVSVAYAHAYTTLVPSTEKP